MPSLPTLDMTGWSILDFELAYDVLMKKLAVGVSATSQWRAPLAVVFITADIIDAADAQVLALIEHLRAIRFEDRGEDDRRIRLLIRDAIDNRDTTLPALIQMTLDQAVRAAA